MIIQKKDRGGGRDSHGSTSELNNKEKKIRKMYKKKVIITIKAGLRSNKK